jgi:hypothetical protein
MKREKYARTDSHVLATSTLLIYYMHRVIRCDLRITGLLRILIIYMSYRTRGALL